MLLLLTACGSGPPRQQKSALDQKKASHQGTIHAVEMLPSKENCGMIHYVPPVYPKEAKRARIHGVVIVDYVIAKTGEVRDLHVVSGDPVLIPAAIAAAKLWRYAPCRPIDSEPVEVKLRSNIPFTLSQ